MSEERYRGAEAARWYFWEGGFLAVGRSRGVIPTHSHHAVQMFVSLEGPARLRHGEGEWQEFEAGAVLPDEPHAFDGDGVLGAMLLVDPETREGSWLRQSLSAPISALPPQRLWTAREAVRAFYDEPPDAAGTSALVEFVVRQFCTGIMPRSELDERVTQALRSIQSMDATRISLDDVASKVFLSPSRFAHLFSEQVGIPFRRYVLWRRLTRAMVLVTRGQTLSRAAHAAGFADSAHFTRTFYQMFGIPPSALLGHGEMYEIPAPFELDASAREGR